MLKNLLSAIMLSGLLFVGCGSSDEGSSGEEEGPKYFEIMNAEKTYSMDDIKNAGLKGIKEFKTDAVDKKTGDLLEEIYKKVCINEPKIARMSIESAEITKIALNSFVTMKISFANTLANITEKVSNADKFKSAGSAST